MYGRDELSQADRDEIEGRLDREVDRKTLHMRKNWGGCDDLEDGTYDKSHWSDHGNCEMEQDALRQCFLYYEQKRQKVYDKWAKLDGTGSHDSLMRVEYVCRYIVHRLARVQSQLMKIWRHTGFATDKPRK